MSVRPGLGHVIFATAVFGALGIAPASLVLAQGETAAPAEVQSAQPSAPATPSADTPAKLVPATVPDAPADLASTQKALEEIETSISMSQERRDALKKEIEALSGDPAKQNAALIAAAQRVRMAEIEIADVEERLGNLIVEELEVRGRLDGADTDIANVLAALERVSLNPPPALIVNPSDALGSARSAILLSSILPQLRAKADAVTADLQRLTEIKAEAVKEEALLKANFAVLEEEQLRIATLIAARKQGVDQVSAELAAAEEEAITLAARATSLKELVSSLSAQAGTVSAAEQPSDSAPPEAGAMEQGEVRVALADTSRTAPAIPFASAKGYLTLPTGGENVIDFGASDGFGGISQGMSVVTPAQAQVVAPADGWVMYKGPYLNYGEIVILNPGDEYTILLAGLETVSVNIGQFVMMGEPIGTMGSHTIGQTLSTSAGNSRPTLYIEMRKNNEPVDPTNWWNPDSNPTQSG